MNHIPIISICIPTYNREEYLDMCIFSIVKQIELNKDLLSQVEIIISDNASRDNSSLIAKKYKNKPIRLRYYRNIDNIGINRNYLKVASYAKGKYVWFMSDDDIMQKGAISKVLKALKQFSPDVLIGNSNQFDNFKHNIVEMNNLRINKDSLFKIKKDFFMHLQNKFFYSIDWYTTFLSTFIIKKSIFEAYKFPKKIDDLLVVPCPYSAPYFYSSNDYSLYILSDIIVSFRSNNRSWGPLDKKKFLFFWDKLLKRHYEIMITNNDDISYVFKIKLKLKRIIRRIRLFATI